MVNFHLSHHEIQRLRRNKLSRFKSQTVPSFDASVERIRWGVVKRTDLSMIETGLIDFEKTAQLLCARHFFHRKTKGLGRCLKTPVARPVVTSNRFPSIQPRRTCIIELGQVVALQLIERR